MEYKQFVHVAIIYSHTAKLAKVKVWMNCSLLCFKFVCPAGNRPLIKSTDVLVHKNQKETLT